MSRATRHLERLLKALQSNSTSTLGKCRTEEDFIPPSFDSTQVVGTSDPLGKEMPESSQISFLLCSDSDGLSTPSGDNDRKYYQEEMARLVQQLGNNRVQVATLQAQIEFLTNKVEKQEMVDSLYIQRLEGEVLHLEDIVEKEMIKLSRRQTQVEQDVPSLGEQLKTIKDLLHDFNVSKTMYMELKSIPQKQRTTKEDILILVYEKYQHDQEEILKLQMSRDNSREALTRANDEVQRLTRELQRMAANHAIDHREFELDYNSHIARIERLEVELCDFLVRIEVLSAKGTLFDEVQRKLETLEAKNIDVENQNAVIVATLQVAIEEKESMRDSLKEKDHTLDLLSMDKIYLSKKVHHQAEQLQKLEAELQRLREKLREVKHVRQELYDKVLSNNKESQTTNELRLQAKISQIHDQTNQDIENFHKEAVTIADEKVWTFHEMRDEATSIVDMCRVELQDSKGVYNELLLKFQELQRISDLKEAETRNNLKIANFELDRLKVVLEKTKNALDQTRLENETWIAKVKILKEKVNGKKSQSIEVLKNELEKPVNELKEELRVTRAQIKAYQKERTNKLEADQSETQGVQLKAYDSEINLQIGISEREKFRCVSILQAKTLEDNERKLRGSLLENKELEEKLRSAITEKDRVSIRLQLIQEDIKKLLCAQGSVEQLRSLLKDKRVFVGSGNRLKPINISTQSSLKVKKGLESEQHSISP